MRQVVYHRFSDGNLGSHRGGGGLNAAWGLGGLGPP